MSNVLPLKRELRYPFIKILLAEINDISNLTVKRKNFLRARCSYQGQRLLYPKLIKQIIDFSTLLSIEKYFCT